MGILCWCEMPSPYEFKDETIVNLTREWQEVVRQFYNHPSIVCWVPINESWGVPRVVNDATNQHLQNALYEITNPFLLFINLESASVKDNCVRLFFSI